jgi:hypothetical protein
MEWPILTTRRREDAPAWSCSVHAQPYRMIEMRKENDLEGAQDQGGKHGGQAGFPKPTPPPAKTQQDKETEKVRGQRR